MTAAVLAPPPADPAVRTVALRREFGALVAVAGIDLTVAQGEVFGLLTARVSSTPAW